jgi:hypothetical protein
MKAIKWLWIALAVYLAIVVAFESLVGVMGRRQAARGLDPTDRYAILTTTDAAGSQDTVVAVVERDGRLYLSANHWTRGWYHRAIANPDVEVARAGGKEVAYRAVPLTGEERDRIARDYSLPFAIRFLTGFPPRSFLRLDPR